MLKPLLYLPLVGVAIVALSSCSTTSNFAQGLDVHVGHPVDKTMAPWTLDAYVTKVKANGSKEHHFQRGSCRYTVFEDREGIFRAWSFDSPTANCKTGLNWLGPW